MKIPKLEFIPDPDNEDYYDVITEDGIIIAGWPNNAQWDFPEDLTIGRDIGDLIQNVYQKAYKAGFEAGKKK